MILHLPRPQLFAIAIAVILSACASGGGASRPEPRTIQVEMTDELRFTPAEFTVKAGETVRVEVANRGQIIHEFLIGDEAAQETFEMEMAERDGMPHHTDAGVSVEPGGTEAVEYTFDEPGQLLAGCHEPGHYDGGMVATIVVTE